MEPITEQQLNSYLHNSVYNFENLPLVNENMNHSMRFWLAIKLFRKHKKLDQKVTLVKYSLHFDINYKSLLKFANGFQEPVDFGYLSPGEYNTRNSASIIKTYGREQDKKKFLKKF